MWKGIRYATIFMLSVALFAQILGYIPNNYMKVLAMLNVISLVIFSCGTDD